MGRGWSHWSHWSQIETCYRTTRDTDSLAGEVGKQILIWEEKSRLMSVCSCGEVLVCSSLLNSSKLVASDTSALSFPTQPDWSSPTIERARTPIRCRQDREQNPGQALKQR
ncbi:unnamed protein product [Pleuronectes platessa]|uniref:Uncharacterized protein n=1 Tax=Pleuronectes platessa TaxID=8262 RepID=A0A9N7Z670_PLEPL|nr:unnamed protein product [Pleuronectes platessa]